MAMEEPHGEMAMVRMDGAGRLLLAEGRVLGALGSQHGQAELCWPHLWGQEAA